MTALLNKLFHLLAGRRYHRLFLLAGLLLALWGLKGLGAAAVFVHEAVRVPAVVTDVTQKPFSSAWEALRGGNWKAEVAYYPHVSYSIPDGQGQHGWRLPDGDANDHRIGEQVEILTMPNDPTTAHLTAWKFIWGEPTATFCGGVLLFLFGQLLRGRRTRRAARPAERRSERRPEPRREAPEHRVPPRPRAEEREAPAPRKRAKKGQMELGLEVDEAPAKPKRKRKAAADGAPKTPRKRKKKEA